jgi:hypothetical protein
MFAQMGLHIILNPAGSYSYVGSIPTVLGKRVKPTSSDIMAGRFFKDGEDVYTVKFPVFSTRQEAVNHAASFDCEVLS